MTTIQKRLRTWFNVRKPRADDNIERSEPETFLATSFGFAISLVLTAAFMMLIYFIMSGQMAEWIGAFLAAQSNALTFDERLAGFAAVSFLLISVVITFALELSRQASHDDIVDVVNDLGEQVDERFAELEERISEALEPIKRDLDDITILTRLEDLSKQERTN